MMLLATASTPCDARGNRLRILHVRPFPHDARHLVRKYFV
jgi:hypothetical protein